ncbi:MAG: hypothetical protein K2V38_11940 [Gemmataceae bacterium]|nr:hypothetical protein [Gemmataceae bacterium]
MARMFSFVALVLALGAAGGCGDKPAPTQPDAAIETEPKKDDPTPAPKVETPKIETPKAALPTLAWEPDPDKHAIPQTPVRGRVGGAEVTPEVSLTDEDLVLRVFNAETKQFDRTVRLRLAPRTPGQPTGAPLPGRSWKVKPADPPGAAVPDVWLEQTGQPILSNPSGYALTLDLSPRKDGKVTGRLYLALTEQTVLAGTFVAEYLRPPTEKPGDDDAPFAAGEVTVTGADPKAVVRVAYSSFQPSGVFIKELPSGFSDQPAELAPALTDAADKPRVSTVIPGDGKVRPFRYEHVKLPPGRYLLTAAVAKGPAVWRWVDVPADGMLTENFALDATKTGGLEVTVPDGAAGKFLIAPADDPSKPPLDAPYFEILSLQFARGDVELLAGKAVLKQLGPGRYEVRFGTERRLVEVVAGKTAEVSFVPAKK